MLLNCFHESYMEAGCDEAGRGCLVGPVYAAAVILPRNFNHEILNDSKKLNPEQRESLRIEIEEKAIAWSVASVGAEEIDQINILNASYLAMHKAISSLNTQPQHLAIDGNRFKAFADIPHTCVVKGDGKYMNIAAASILAKTHRDAYMLRLSKEYPEYHWHQNKGYGTPHHRTVTLKLGMTPHHRKTFKIIDPQMKLFG